jgi:hypothetical protein
MSHMEYNVNNIRGGKLHCEPLTTNVVGCGEVEVLAAKLEKDPCNTTTYTKQIEQKYRFPCRLINRRVLTTIWA